MSPVTETDGNSYILYDPELFGKIDSSWFDVKCWKGLQNITGSAQGRGSAWFIQVEKIELVLRHYHRGGLIEPLLNDRYIWTGLNRTRALREWNLLALMKQQNLPVPRPVAAQVTRSGPFYRADILVQRIPDAESLSVHLSKDSLARDQWKEIGSSIKRFHNAGIYHADLNAHNILVSGDAQIYLIDFDKGCQRASGNWGMQNMQRLQRSLQKLSGSQPSFAYNEAAWEACMQGYHQDS